MSIFFRDGILQTREKKCAYKEFSVRLFICLFLKRCILTRGVVLAMPLNGGL